MNLVRRYWRGMLVLLVILMTFVLGYWGLQLHFARQGQCRSFWDIGYFVLYLFVMEAGEAEGSVPWQLIAARWLGAGVTFWAVLRASLLLFGERVQAALPNFWRRHVVICGLGRKGFQLAEEFRARSWRVAVIEADPDNAHLARCRELGAVVFSGDAADATLLTRARAYRARYVFMMTGNDGTNVAGAMQLHHMKKERPRDSRLTTCMVHLVDLHLCALFKQHSLFRDDTDQLEVRVFNAFENAARMLLKEHPLEGDTAEDFCKQPHLAVLGFGKMGQSVALQAAKTAHYASGKPLRITVIDRNAERLSELFLGCYPAFTDLCDTAFIQAEINSVTTIKRLVDWARDEGQRLTVAVCLDEDSESLEAATRLAAQLRGHEVPVYVRMAEINGLAALFEGQEGNAAWMGLLRPFALICHTCRIETVLEEEQDQLARAIHGAHVKKKSEKGTTDGDPSMQPWDRLAPTFRDSNRQQADHIPVKLRAVGCCDVAREAPGAAVEAFTEDEVELLAKMEHNRWNAERFLGGWTKGKCAPEDKERLRITPYLVPWEELPNDIQEYDRDAVREIPAHLERIGRKAVRTAG